MIVPVQTGAGTRIKVAEGFSRKCPMVSTTLGAFGYDITSGEEMLLADQPKAFAEACLLILQQAGLGEQLANRAWEKYVKRWTWNAIAPKVAEALEHCLSLSRGREQLVT
jgi:glycosyltransferase involved in cell wall biosynthesis